MKVFHHNDIDGHAAAAIIRLIYKNLVPVQYIECNYTFSLFPYIETIYPGEQIFVVDYSFQQDTLPELLAMIQKAGLQNITWIDHHQSSLTLQGNYPNLQDIPGIRCKNISGAALTWMYLEKQEFSDIPPILQYISDYDCWLKTMEGTDEVYHGILAEDWNYNSMIWSKYLNDTDAINTLSHRGSAILDYLHQDNRMILKKWTFETELEGYKCLAVNRKVNSAVFGDNLSEYPLYCIFQFDGIRWRYSIYSQQIDCSLLAAKFGGGGHKAASGFSHPDCLFTKHT